MREDLRYIVARCPVCQIVSPVCDQQKDTRRQAISAWWFAHFDKVHRFGPVFDRAEAPALIDGSGEAT